MTNGTVQFEIRKHIGTLSKNEKTGWTREINKVSWNGGYAKYDIRDWSPDHERPGRGITLTDEEAKALAAALTKHLPPEDEPLKDWQ